MAIRHNAGSITFNPLGMGGGVIDFLGKNNVNRAQTTGMHTAFCSEDDWLSGKSRRNVVGNLYSMPHNDKRGLGNSVLSKNSQKIHEGFDRHLLLAMKTESAALNARHGQNVYA
jgi:hypothetical protein